MAVPDAPNPVPLDPAVTTSRKELPVAAVPATRRFLPLTALVELAPTFSFVLEVSDRESSGGGRDLAGGILNEATPRLEKSSILTGSLDSSSRIACSDRCRAWVAFKRPFRCAVTASELHRILASARKMV
jgi:hypothetical protein